MRYLLVLICFVYSVHAQTLTVFAASSLTDAFTELSEIFEKQNPGTDIIFSFASSSTLATQIEQGAEADVFASADIQNVARVVPKDDVTVFTKNKLVVFVNAKANIFNEDEIDDPLDSSLALYGEGFADKVLSRLVSNEPNAKQVLTKVGLEADVGIAYASDMANFATRYGYILAIPDEYNVIAEYGMAVLPESLESQLAQQFVDFVVSEAGQAVLQKHGFLPR
jgi:molybdate transport system substrate-binding protein